MNNADANSFVGNSYRLNFFVWNWLPEKRLLGYKNMCIFNRCEKTILIFPVAIYEHSIFLSLGWQ